MNHVLMALVIYVTLGLHFLFAWFVYTKEKNPWLALYALFLAGGIVITMGVANGIDYYYEYRR